MKSLSLDLNSSKDLQKDLKDKEESLPTDNKSTITITSAETTSKMDLSTSVELTTVTPINDSSEKEVPKEVTETTKTEKKEEKKEKRSTFKKWVNPKPGSVQGSVYNMIILSLGSGCLSLPKYIGENSLFFSILVTVVIGFFVWRAFDMILKACDKEKTYVFENLIEKILGKGFSIFYNSIVIMNSLGVIILNIVISKNF